MMTTPTPEASPHFKARLTGVVYFLYFLTAVLGALFTPATAQENLAHEPSFRLGFAVSLILHALYIVLTALFFNLFKAVNGSLAFLAAFFSLVGRAIQAFGGLFQRAPWVVLGGSQ